MVILDFRCLVSDTRCTQAQAFALGTWANLLLQWVKYLTFCVTFGLKALPAEDVVLMWYAQYLSYTFKAHASVVNYLSGVKTLHVLLNFEVRGFEGFLLKLTVRGLHKSLSFYPKQALAITPLILLDIYSTLDHQDPVHATFWAACLTAFFLLLRKSNFMADSLNQKCLSHLLHRQDFRLTQHDVKVTLRWLKTNQFGQHLEFSLPVIPGSVLCPVCALANMWGLVPGEMGICFRRRTGQPFTYYQFHTLLRESLKAAGYQEQLFSSHSFCRGGTSFAFLCGVPTELIGLLGGWQSDCYFRYLEFPMEARAAVTALMKHRIQVMNW